MARWALALWILGLVAACGYTGVNGDPYEQGVPAPARPKAAPGADDAGGPAPVQRPAPAPIVDAGTADATTKPPSTTCNASDLALCFAFEGNAKDQGGGALTPATFANVSFVPGRDDQAASFTANSAMRFAPNDAFELPANATIEAWIKRDANAADAVVFDDDGRFSLTINAAGNVWCKSSGGAVTGRNVVPVAKWAHVACVVDAGTLRAYLDGAEEAAGPGAIGSAPTLGAALGGNSPDGEPFIGLIDSFRLFRVARTPDQIKTDAKP